MGRRVANVRTTARHTAPETGSAHLVLRLEELQRRRLQSRQPTAASVAVPKGREIIVAGAILGHEWGPGQRAINSVQEHQCCLDVEPAVIDRRRP